MPHDLRRTEGVTGGIRADRLKALSFDFAWAMVKQMSSQSTQGGDGTSTEARGRIETRGTSRMARSKSRDMIAGVEKRLTDMETNFDELVDRVGDLNLRCDGFEAEDVAIHDAVRTTVGSVDEALRFEIESLNEALSQMRDLFQRQFDQVLQKMENLSADVALCKLAVVAGEATGHVQTVKVEVPKPKTFSGARNAREVENFLWGLEQYFQAAGMTDDASKVRNAALYLADTAMLWWRRMHGDVRRGARAVQSFEDFKRELKRQFYPENAEDEARGRLRRLKQTGSIRGYVDEFTSLILEIEEMSDRDGLFFFSDGLQPWARQELKRRGVQSLAEAIAVAESLIDHFGTKDLSRGQEKKDDPSKNGGDLTREAEAKGGASRPWLDKGKGKVDEGPPKPRTNCFLCGGPHWARECPQRKALSTLRITESDGQGGQEDVVQMGALQRLGGIRLLPNP